MYRSVPLFDGILRQVILTLAYNFIELVAQDWLRPVYQTKDPDPYPLSNGGQN